MESVIDAKVPKDALVVKVVARLHPILNTPKRRPLIHTPRNSAIPIRYPQNHKLRLNASHFSIVALRAEIVALHVRKDDHGTLLVALFG